MHTKTYTYCMYTRQSWLIYSTFSFTLCCPRCVLLMSFFLWAIFPINRDLVSPCYLKMKIKSMSSIQKVATLSIVFISTTSCRLSAGMNLTSLMTLSSRKVLSTDRPPSAWPMISHTLGYESHRLDVCVCSAERHTPWEFWTLEIHNPQKGDYECCWHVARQFLH